VRTTGTPLAAGLALDGGQLTVQGRAAAAWARASRTGANALLAAAQAPDVAAALGKLSARQRADLVAELTPLLEERAAGRPTLQDVARRAGAFLLLEALATAMRTSGEAGARSRLTRALDVAAHPEPDARLRLWLRDPARGSAPVPLPAHELPVTTFTMKPRARPLAGNAAWLASAVGALDAHFHAWSAGAPRLAPGAWFTGGPNDPVVKIERGRVSLNDRYAHLDPDALATLVCFDATRALLDTHHATMPLSEKRLVALAVAAQHVHATVAYADLGDAILVQLAKARGFPPGLSFAAVAKAMTAPGAERSSAAMRALLERAMQYTFLEVNPNRTSAKFRMLVGRALDLMARSETAIGRHTYEVLATGRVRIDSLDDFSRADYIRVRRDFAKDDIHLPEVQNAKALRAITASINGYMWDDRVYVSEELSAKQIASTLVHEVNHVLNHSEEHYRGPKQTLVEEYRAFYAERLFAGLPLGPAECKKLKEGVIRDYNLVGVTADDVPDVPPGIL
jgi:hypothetical protein